MTELLVNKQKQTKEARPNKNNWSDDNSKLSHDEWLDKMKAIERAIFLHAKKKGGMPRHRSSDDLLQESPRNVHFTKLARTAHVNPFKIHLYQVPHKTSREMQLMPPEAVQKRKDETHKKNAKLMLLRRQSFPSIGNDQWKDAYIKRGVI